MGSDESSVAKHLKTFMTFALGVVFSFISVNLLEGSVSMINNLVGVVSGCCSSFLISYAAGVPSLG